MTRRSFLRLVREGMEQIPVRFQRYLNDVAVVVEQEPTSAQKRSAGVAVRDELLGLYEGTPHTARPGLPYRLPDKITLFQVPLERICRGERTCIRDEVAHTVWHELAHALGMAEHRVRTAERRRRRQRMT